MTRLEEFEYWTMDEAFEEGMIDLEQKEYYEEWLQSTIKLHNSDIRDYKITAAKEKAKRISVNHKFQKAVADFRKRWNVSPCLPSEELYPLWDPEYVLNKYIFIDKSSEEEWNILLFDIDKSVCQPCGLDWKHDCGLIVVAVCFELTFTNIIEHWDKIFVTAASEISPGVSLMLYSDTSEKRKSLGSLLTIAYLTNMLVAQGVNPNKFPGSIKEWVGKAACACKSLIALNEDSIPFYPSIAIDAIKGRPKDNSDKPNLYILIDPSTKREDVIRTWPQVELRQLETYGKSASSNRQWRTYERDVTILSYVKNNGMTYEKAYDKWLSKHPDDKPIEISAIIHATNKVDRISKSERL